MSIQMYLLSYYVLIDLCIDMYSSHKFHCKVRKHTIARITFLFYHILCVLKFHPFLFDILTE